MRTSAFPLLILLTACGSPKPLPLPPKSPAIESADHAHATFGARGTVAMSEGKATFHECGTPGAAAKVLADPGQAVAGAFAALSVQSADGLYVELDDAGALVRAHRLGAAGACDEPVFGGEFMVYGGEPSWTVEITDAGIVYRDAALVKGRTFPYAFTRTETGSVLYATKLDKPVSSTLEIALEPARCIDPTHAELTSFKAHVVMDGKKLEGCAAAGVPRGEFGDAPLDELNRFTGTYPATLHLWNDPAIEKRMAAMLGNSLPEFFDHMKGGSPLMKDAGVFYATGNKQHQGGLDNAVFLADPASDTIEIVLLTHGLRQDFKEGGREVARPSEVVKEIDNMEKP